MGWKVRTKSSKNRKIKNATPIEVDGIQFKSKLEGYCHRQLLLAGIPAEYEPNKYVLIPPFEYNGEKIRACTYTPDFVGEGFIIECKGLMTDSFTIKWKMFKQYLARLDSKIDLYLPRNQHQVVQVIELIKAKKVATNKK